MRVLEDVLVWGCIYLYGIGSVLLLLGFVLGKEKFLGYVRYFVVPGFAAHTIIFISRWARTGYFPANGELENAITSGWVAVGVTVYFFFKNRSLTGLALFTVPATLMLLGYGIMKAPEPLPMAASLKSSWLIIHVAFAQIAFGAYVIASGFGVVYLLKDRAQRRHTDSGFYERFPKLEIIDEKIFRFVVLGFVTEALMIPAGAIWAKELWGNYWTWDPVEVWSLVSWLLYGLAIHLRVTLGWRGRRLAWLIVLLLGTVIMTYWGVDAAVENTRHMFGVNR